MRKEIKMGHGLYKYVEEKMGLMSGDITSDEDVITATGQSVSEIMQDELEPIIHPTQHDESDDIEKSKLAEGELTEFEKSELKRKVKKRSVWGNCVALGFSRSLWQEVDSRPYVLIERGLSTECAR